MPQYRVYRNVEAESGEVALVTETDQLEAAEASMAAFPLAHIEQTDGLFSTLIDRTDEPPGP